MLSRERREGRYEAQSWQRMLTWIAKVYARRAKASLRFEAVIASRSLRREARTVASSFMESVKAFWGIGWCWCVVDVFVEVEARGGRLACWCSGGACLERESEEKEDVSLEFAVEPDFVSVDVDWGTLTETKRRSSSSRWRAQSFM